MFWRDSGCFSFGPGTGEGEVLHLPGVPLKKFQPRVPSSFPPFHPSWDLPSALEGKHQRKS